MAVPNSPRVANVYVLGTKVRIWAAFYAAPTNPFQTTKGALANPSVVDVKWTLPNGTVDENDSPTNAATGIYYDDITTTVAGRYHYQWTGDGFIQEGWFDVRPSRFINQS